ncbi:MAG: alpha/beta hydrolase, partial [Rhodospirillaceae bacterium]|nr:alpha/beta hydrolase [Rhodospirillaceae bacterium]
IAWGELYEARSYLERWQVAGRAAADALEAGGRDGLVAFLREHGGTRYFKVIPPAGHPFREPVIQLLANHPVAEYRTGMLEMAASVPDVIPRLEKLDVPVMGINGTADPFIEDPARLAGVRSFRQVEPVEGAGRFLHWECPDIFNDRLTDFFGL